jgi:hypothetical protein
MLRRVIITCCCVVLVTASLAAGQTATTAPATTAPTTAPSSPKKLIEFGWDEPDTAFMRKHIAAMEQTPFDGTVFHTKFTDEQGKPQRFSNHVWGKRTFTDAELRPALDDLKATPFKRFTHNFHRFNVLPGNVDWFDDFSAIVSNARLFARITKEAKVRGILFDIEPYDSPLWHYAKQRDAAMKSWEQYAAQARLRGREVMNAFQEGYPDVPVLLTFGYSWPLAHMMRKEGATTLQGSEVGLLAPFLDGMFDAVRGNAKIIDGFELSYGYREDQRFDDARRRIRGEDGEVLKIVGNREKYRSHGSLAFGIWMDYDSGNKGWDPADASKNHFTPQQFEQSVRKALATTDAYVWIYTERAKWWDAEGKPEKLPAAYDQALRRAGGK